MSLLSKRYTLGMRVSMYLSLAGCVPFHCVTPVSETGHRDFIFVSQEPADPVPGATSKNILQRTRHLQTRTELQFLLHLNCPDRNIIFVISQHLILLEPQNFRFLSFALTSS